MRNHICVVGCGRWGKNLVRTFSQLEALGGICDTADDNLKALAQSYNVPTMGWQQALDDPSILGVAIATPSVHHARMAMEALEAGKHVFVEKPMAMSAAEAHALFEKATLKNLLLKTGHIMRYHPVFYKIKELIAANSIGEVRSISTSRTSWGRVHGQSSCYADEEDALWDLAPHDISVIVDLMGEKLPTHIEAWGVSHFSPAARKKEFYDDVKARFVFDGQVQAFMHVSWMGPEKKRTLTITGQHGSLVFDDVQPWEKKLALYAHHLGENAQENSLNFTPGEQKFIQVPQKEPLVNECASFLQHIEQAGEKIAANDRGEEGWRVLKVLESIRHVLSKGQSQPHAQPGGQAKKLPIVDLAGQQAGIRPSIDAAIAKVLNHGQYILGPEVSALEAQLQSYCGVKHAITCSNGTTALVLALMVLGVKAGDAVLVPSFTFVATAEAVALCGAMPIFVDVRSDTYNIDCEHLTKSIQANKECGIHPVGIISVDIFGQPADYTSLCRIAEEHGMWVIADSAQSFGSAWEGKKVGTLAHITCTSFFPSKPLGCYGDGGAVFTDNDDYATQLRSLRNHGAGSNQYNNVVVGKNSRLDSIQAAILLEKLKIFDAENAKRQYLAQCYGELLASCPFVELPQLDERAHSCWSLYTLRLKSNSAQRAHIISALSQKGIEARVYYQTPVHLQPAYAPYLKAQANNTFPVSERIANEVLSLPLGCSMTKADVAYVVENVLTHCAAKLPAFPA